MMGVARPARSPVSWVSGRPSGARARGKRCRASQQVDGKNRLPHVVSLYDLPVRRGDRPTTGLVQSLEADRVLLVSEFMR